MKQLAKTAAAIGFFGLAFVGWSTGVPVFICGLRALAGAAALYVLVRLAGAAVVRIVVDAAIRAARDKHMDTRRNTIE